MTGFLEEVSKQGRLQSVSRLLECNAVTARYGLRLSNAQARALVERRALALQESGRVEFGEGVLHLLAMEFCDSPYIQQEDWQETLAALQELFYYFKNESRDGPTDDELIAGMKRCFDEYGGSLDYIAGASPDELCTDDEER